MEESVLNVHQADVKISFINLEKRGTILYFVVSPYICFLRKMLLKCFNYFFLC